MHIAAQVCGFPGLASLPRSCRLSKGSIRRRYRCIQVAQATAQPLDTSNMSMPRSSPTKQPLNSHRHVLQEEMQRLLRQDDSWHEDQDAPANIMVATSPQHIKSVLEAADPNSIVVLDFFAPHCRACRGMWGAKKKLAATNPDIIFMKVDATNSQLGPMVKALGVTRMPWFIIMRGGTGDQLASFTANLDTFNVFRAEVAAAKTCTDPQCITSDDEPSR